MKNVHIHSDPIRKFIMIIIHYSVHLVGLRCFHLEMCKDGRFQSKQIIITGLPKGYNDGHLLCIHLPANRKLYQYVRGIKIHAELFIISCTRDPA